MLNQCSAEAESSYGCLQNLITTTIGENEHINTEISVLLIMFEQLEFVTKSCNNSSSDIRLAIAANNKNTFCAITQYSIMYQYTVI